MSLRPTSKNVLLIPEPPPTQTAGGIHLVESNRWTSDEKVFQVFACGSSVPFDIQPGMRCIVDGTSLNVREFEYEGVRYKIAPWTEVKLVLGVAS